MAPYQSVPTVDNASSIEKPKVRISGLTDIIINVISLTIPMLILSAILLVIVFQNIMTQEKLPADALGDFAPDHGWYFVQFSATRLVFIASLSSTAAPIIGMCIVSLWSFPVAVKMLELSKHETENSMPTPFQLTLTLRMLSGSGFGPLWHWLKYIWTWRNRRQPHSHALTSVGSASVLAMFLGFLVILADVWLHVSTTTVPFTRTNLLPNHEIELPRYAYRMNDTCTTATSNCTAITLAKSHGFLKEGARGIEVLNNISTSIVTSTYGTSNPFVYLGVSPAKDIMNVDYMSQTYGVRTQCSSKARECNLSNTGASVTYECNDVFKGVIMGVAGMQNNGTMARFNLRTFTDQAMTIDKGYGYASDGYARQAMNPYYTGIALLSSGIDMDSLQWPSFTDVRNPNSGGIAYILGCQTTVYDITYSWVNGSVTSFDAKVSNDSNADLAATLVGSSWSPNMQPYLEMQALLAGQSDNFQELADKMAFAYSRIAISSFLSALEQDKVSRAQSRTTILVAKVLIAALWCLIAANLLFVITGAILLAVALYVRREGVDDVQARLSIAGLVADRFERNRRDNPVEQIEELFDEYQGAVTTRVAVARARKGGFTYVET